MQPSIRVSPHIPERDLPYKADGLSKEWKFSRKPPKAGASAAGGDPTEVRRPAKRARTHTRQASSSTTTTSDDVEKHNYSLVDRHAFLTSASASPQSSPPLPTQPFFSACAGPSQSYEDPYVFPQIPRYAQSIRKPLMRAEPLPAHSLPDGLHKTLARRSSSAVELFNVFKSLPAIPYLSSTFGGTPIGNGQAFPAQTFQEVSIHRSSSTVEPLLGSSAPQELPPFYSINKLLSFTEFPQSMPAFLPFGMSTGMQSPPWQNLPVSKPANDTPQTLDVSADSVSI